MNFWEFASGNPWLTFFLALLVALVAEEIVKTPYRAYKLSVRRKNIAQHGWPPAPLDADGDVIYPKKEGEE